VTHFRVPVGTSHVRVDSGVRTGDEISIHYDPMVAKLIVWDRNRELARERLVKALGEVELVGFANNVEFLLAVARHPAFAAGEVDTGFIERHGDQLFATPAPAGDEIFACAALALLLAERLHVGEVPGLCRSPWSAVDGWRLNLESHREFRFNESSVERKFSVFYGREGYECDFGAGRIEAAVEPITGEQIRIAFGGHCFDAAVVRRDLTFHVFTGGTTYRLTMTDPLAAAEAIEAPTGRLTAPMPGRIIHLHVKRGDPVKHGDTLLVLEAMKMEHSILAPSDGIVEVIDYAVGDLVEEGVELLSLAIEGSK
jgi:3-methylcrotonyl-CoA carboxylase alpha subunit